MRGVLVSRRGGADRYSRRCGKSLPDARASSLRPGSIRAGEAGRCATRSPERRSLALTVVHASSGKASGRGAGQRQGARNMASQRTVRPAGPGVAGEVVPRRAARSAGASTPVMARAAASRSARAFTSTKTSVRPRRATMSISPPWPGVAAGEDGVALDDQQRRREPLGGVPAQEGGAPRARAFATPRPCSALQRARRAHRRACAAGRSPARPPRRRPSPTCLASASCSAASTRCRRRPPRSPRPAARRAPRSRPWACPPAR